MPPGVVSRECQFGLHRAFSNEVELFALLGTQYAAGSMIAGRS